MCLAAPLHFFRMVWHRASMSRRPVRTAALAVVLFVVGQLAALAHEASTRHIVCPEHGEQLETVAIASSAVRTDEPRWVGVDGEGSGAHADCEIARALAQSGVAPHLPALALSIVVPAATSIEVVAAAPAPSFELYRIAPKTSPPRAG